MGFIHRARMKGGDLVIVFIGGDIGLCGIGIIDDLNVAVVDTLFSDPLGIGGEVLPRCSHCCALPA